MNKIDDDELDIFYNQKSNVAVKVHTSQVKQQRPQSSKPSAPKPDKPQKPSEQVQPKTKEMISMKAFIFNFKRFYKEKTKIRSLLSQAAAKQRTVNLKVYLKNYQNSYKEVKTMFLQTKISEVKMLQRFEDLAYLNLGDQQDTRIYVRDGQTDKLANMCRDSLQELFEQKESAFYEKRVIVKYLNQLYNEDKHTPTYYPKLLNKYKDIQALSSNKITVIGQFIQGFKKIVTTQFKLVDVAHYLYEFKFNRNDVEIITSFITKVKTFYNTSKNRQKEEPIDGDKLLPFELVTTCFNIMSQKDLTNGYLIEELLSSLRKLINEQIKVETVDRVRAVMELNIIGDYMMKYFKDLDQQISSHLCAIDQITHLIYSIDKLNLPTKQDQLEVLLGYIHKVQQNQIEEETATIVQKHSKILQDLMDKFEQTIEEAQLKPQSYYKQTIDMQGEMIPIKKVLYEDDLKDAETFTNPYKVETADSPIRKPKKLNVNKMKSQVKNIQEIQEIQEIQDAEKMINQMIEYDYDKQELAVSQMNNQSKEGNNLRYENNVKDVLYEQEFEKLKQSTKAQSKEDMIRELQKQITSLRQEVSLFKSQK